MNSLIDTLKYQENWAKEQLKKSSIIPRKDEKPIVDSNVPASDLTKKINLLIEHSDYLVNKTNEDRDIQKDVDSAFNERLTLVEKYTDYLNEQNNNIIKFVETNVEKLDKILDSQETVNKDLQEQINVLYRAIKQITKN